MPKKPAQEAGAKSSERIIPLLTPVQRTFLRAVAVNTEGLCYMPITDFFDRPQNWYVPIKNDPKAGLLYLKHGVAGRLQTQGLIARVLAYPERQTCNTKTTLDGKAFIHQITLKGRAAVAGYGIRERVIRAKKEWEKTGVALQVTLDRHVMGEFDMLDQAWKYIQGQLSS